jgi:hypothetical protein
MSFLQIALIQMGMIFLGTLDELAQEPTKTPVDAL